MSLPWGPESLKCRRGRRGRRLTGVPQGQFQAHQHWPPPATRFTLHPAYRPVLVTPQRAGKTSVQWLLSRKSATSLGNSGSGVAEAVVRKGWKAAVGPYAGQSGSLIRVSVGFPALDSVRLCALIFLLLR